MCRWFDSTSGHHSISLNLLLFDFHAVKKLAVESNHPNWRLQLWARPTGRASAPGAAAGRHQGRRGLPKYQIALSSSFKKSVESNHFYERTASIPQRYASCSARGPGHTSCMPARSFASSPALFASPGQPSWPPVRPGQSCALIWTHPALGSADRPSAGAGVRRMRRTGLHGCRPLDR